MLHGKYGSEYIKKGLIIDVIRAFIWNSGGVSFYLVCKWVLTIFVVRFSNGYEDAGLLALAMSVTNIAFMIATYNVRAYQVSDIKEEFSSSTYVTARLVTVVVAFIMCAVYSIIFIGFDYRGAVVIVYMILISGEAFSDVFQGMAQKMWRMDITGLSFLIRGVVLLGVFVTLYVIYGLLTALLGSSITTLLVILFFEAGRVNKLEKIKINFDRSKLYKILKVCFPLLLVSLLNISFLSIARISLENATNIEMLGIFNSATLLGIIMVQVAGFIFVPLINVLSQAITDNNFKRFNRIFLFTCSGITFTVATGIVIIYFIGTDILRLLFGDSIVQYSYLLTEAFYVAGVMSLYSFLIIVLIVMRNLKVLIAGSVIGVLCCILTSQWLLANYGMSGANYMQLIGSSISVIILTIAYIVYYRRLTT